MKRSKPIMFIKVTGLGTIIIRAWSTFPECCIILELVDFYGIWQTEKRQASACHKVNLWEESFIIIYSSRRLKILLRNCRFWTKECWKKAHFTDKRCLMNKFRKIQSSTESTLWNILTSLHALPLSSRGRVEKESGKNFSQTQICHKIRKHYLNRILQPFNCIVSQLNYSTDGHAFNLHLPVNLVWVMHRKELKLLQIRTKRLQGEISLQRNNLCVIQPLMDRWFCNKAKSGMSNWDFFFCFFVLFCLLFVLSLFVCFKTF